jgi:hypothetical protein
MASKPFGKVVVASAGTPVQASINAADQAAPLRIGCQSISFQALPGNAGLVYIQQATGDDRATLVNTLAILPKPSSATTGPFASYTISIPLAAAGFNLADYYINADNAGDGVLISVTQN